MQAAYHAWAEALPLHYGSLDVAQSAAPMPSLIFKLRGDEFQVRKRSILHTQSPHKECTHTMHTHNLRSPFAHTRRTSNLHDASSAAHALWR